LIPCSNPIAGDIGIGEVFAWEPDLPFARELLIVSRIVERKGRKRVIYTWDMNYTREVCNDERRFRDACHRTRFNRFSSSPPRPFPQAVTEAGPSPRPPRS
jgi:hypothetical protein